MTYYFRCIATLIIFMRCGLFWQLSLRCLLCLVERQWANCNVRLTGGTELSQSPIYGGCLAVHLGCYSQDISQQSGEMATVDIREIFIPPFNPLGSK